MAYFHNGTSKIITWQPVLYRRLQTLQFPLPVGYIIEISTVSLLRRLWTTLQCVSSHVPFPLSDHVLDLFLDLLVNGVRQFLAIKHLSFQPFLLCQELGVQLVGITPGRGPGASTGGTQEGTRELRANRPHFR